MEAGVSVGLKRTLVKLEVLAWPLTLAVGRVGEPDRRRGRIARGLVVAHAGPEPSSLGLTVAWCEYRDWCVVGVQLACAQHVIAHGGYQWGQQFAGRTDPAGQRRAIQIDTFAGIDVGLPVERLVVSVLRHQHMRQQPRSGEPVIDRPRRCRRLHDPVAGIAVQLRTYVAQYL